MSQPYEDADIYTVDRQPWNQNGGNPQLYAHSFSTSYRSSQRPNYGHDTPITVPSHPEHGQTLEPALARQPPEHLQCHNQVSPNVDGLAGIGGAGAEATGTSRIGPQPLGEDINRCIRCFLSQRVSIIKRKTGDKARPDLQLFHGPHPNDIAQRLGYKPESTLLTCQCKGCNIFYQVYRYNLSSWQYPSPMGELQRKLGQLSTNDRRKNQDATVHAGRQHVQPWRDLRPIGQLPLEDTRSASSQHTAIQQQQQQQSMHGSSNIAAQGIGRGCPAPVNSYNTYRPGPSYAAVAARRPEPHFPASGAQNSDANSDQHEGRLINRLSGAKAKQPKTGNRRPAMNLDDFNTTRAAGGACDWAKSRHIKCVCRLGRNLTCEQVNAQKKSRKTFQNVQNQEDVMESDPTGAFDWQRYMSDSQDPQPWAPTDQPDPSR